MFPVKGCKAVIAPFVYSIHIRDSLTFKGFLTFDPLSRHAGYSYSGPAAAWAYKSIDTTEM